MPRVSGPAASRSLLFCQDDSAFWLARMPKVERDPIGRVHLEKMMNTLTENAALQTLPQHVR